MSDESNDDSEKTVKELKRANEALRQFAFLASHELREPLRTIVSYLGLLKDRLLGRLDPETTEYIDVAADAARRLHTLVESLLHQARLEKGLRPAWVQGEKILQNALSNLKVSIEESEVEVRHTALPALYCDETQLVQVFQNLIGNAIKFRDPAVPAEIIVSCVPKETEWLFEVRDNGIGIETAFVPRLFEPFRRSYPRSRYPGNGLGLVLCKKIVESHGGRIWVESMSGNGSTFKFTLPYPIEAGRGF